MSIFGSTPPDESPSMRASLFDESSSMTQSQEQTQSTSNSLFQDDSSPWDMPTPRKQYSRADLLRTLLPASDVPESYIETFDAVIREDGAGGKVSSGGVTRVLASAKLDADAQAKIMNIVAPGGGEAALGRNEFNVLLGLVGLAQEGETVSLDGIDERRRSELPFCSIYETVLDIPLYIASCCAYATACTALLEAALSLICHRHCQSGGCALGPQRCVGNWPSHLSIPVEAQELLWVGR